MPVINDSFMPKADPIDPTVDVYQPRSEIYLFWGVELTPSYEHSFDFFKDVNDQLNFFKNRYDTWVGEEYNYFRERSTIRLPRHYEDVLGVNYLCFKNSNHTNDFYMYGFVTEINYINHDAVELVFEVDVLQTYMFRYELRPSFIERETVKDDSRYNHMVDEHLEMGDHIVTFSSLYDLSSMAIVMAYSWAGPDIPDPSFGEMRDGVYTGLRYKWFGVTPAQIAELSSWLETFAKAGLLDNVVSIFMLPAQCIAGTPASIEVQDTTTTIDGYTPRNNKLFNYPYRYCSISNCKDAEQVYKYELFDNHNFLFFTINYNYNMNAAMLCEPANYAGLARNWSMGVPLSDFPVCSWIGNVYANWYARNRLSIGTQVRNAGFNTLVGAATSIATANIGGAFTAFNQITSLMSQLGDRALFPYELRGSTDANTAMVKWGRVGFEFKAWSIRAGYAKRIDNYFSMYGYKVNLIRVPSHKNRLHWDYVKTVGLNIIGRFEQVHVQKIKDIFNNGITFWHDENIMYYDQPNPTV